MDKIDFKKGQKVKFKFANRWGGMIRGKGTVTRLVPKGAQTGAARITVQGDDGVERRLFPLWCTAI